MFGLYSALRRFGIAVTVITETKAVRDIVGEERTVHTEERFPAETVKVFSSKCQFKSGIDGSNRPIGGVGFVVRSGITECEYIPTSERLGVLRFIVKGRHYSLIAAYAPTETGSTPAEKNQFCGDLERLIRQHPKAIVAGDFNLKIGTDAVGWNTSWQRAVADYSDDGETSEMGFNIIDLCDRCRLFMANFKLWKQPEK